ncbi:cell wall hydrolase [Clostridium cylindrosporum]|uniref:Cell wall hydrolase SleB n=1 Tax=Clostridium cylindrosporum DSM 605 TaxID=1121307 RepID=A0A0J8D4Y7_CLOCY|nr:cell wall hydrolase [Clostridium cylindrosporum]KMT20882.1 cell wall hydrolase SleB [Clostridium cylindrosporum DSM 605]
MPLSARELFARMLKCEADGEGDNGMKAVASVIMNRVNASGGEYLRVNQGDLRKVLLQPYQFTCALTTVNGIPNPQNIYNMAPDQKHYDIVDWALANNKVYGTGTALWYYNPFSPECATYFPRNQSGVFATRIVQHCFYDPTPKYFTT